MSEHGSASDSQRDQNVQLNEKLPIEQYVNKELMPALQEALKQLVIEKPDNAIDFLADYMLRNNPQSSEQGEICSKQRMRINAAIDYWFDGNRNQGNGKKWFTGGKQVDDELRSMFTDDLIKIEQGMYKHWLSDKDGALAYIIMCDQFSRNMYRGSGKAFGNDKRTIQFVRDLFHEFLPIKPSDYTFTERYMLSMPLMHSENVDDGRLCVKVCEEQIKLAVAQGNDKAKQTFEWSKKFALEHLEPIEKFGRYPTRNKALGRKSTPEELDYLKSAGGWGQ